MRCYNKLGGLVGWRYVRTLSEDLDGVRDCQYNTKRFIVFQTAILQRAHNITGMKAIWRNITKRLDDWEE